MKASRKALLALIPVLTLLAVGELVARALLPPDHAMGLDEDLLWQVEPGPQNLHATQTTVNSLGLRGAELQVPKPQGQRRLMSLGDSSVFGFGVPDGRVFVEVAAQKLGIEPVNGAMPGYSSQQALAMLERYGEQVEPDLVVVATLWSDNNFDGFVDAELLEQRSGFSLTGALASTGLFRWGSGLLGVMPYNEVGFGTLAQNPRLGRRRVPVQEYVQNLEALVARSQALGAEPVFLMLANEVDVRGETGPMPWDPYRTAMRQVAAEHGCPLIEAAPLFRGKDGLLLDRMHPSTAGHALLGETLADTVRQTGWPGRSACSGGTGQAPQVWDPYVDSAPPAGLPDEAPGITGVTWFGGPAQELVLRMQIDGGAVQEKRLPPKAPFAMEASGQSVHIRAELIDRSGQQHAADFGSFELPARGLVLDFDEHVEVEAMPEVLHHAPPK